MLRICTNEVEHSLMYNPQAPKYIRCSFYFEQTMTFARVYFSHPRHLPHAVTDARPTTLRFSRVKTTDSDGCARKACLLGHL
jgi:hypothetical protein